METTIRFSPFIAGREDLLERDKSKAKKNLEEGLEETCVENMSREEIQNMTEEEYRNRRDKLWVEVWKALDRGDHKRERELGEQYAKLMCARYDRIYRELDIERKEQERKIQEDAERIKKETEVISQTRDSDPQVVEAAVFVRNMTEDILEQKNNLQLKNTGLVKTSGVKKEHVLSNTSVREMCRDVKIYLIQVAGLVEQKIHSLPKDVRKKLDSLMTSFQKLLKGMWRLLVIVLRLYELEKLIVSVEGGGAYILRKKGRLKYGFEMAAMLILWLSHDVETNPGPDSDRTTLEKVVRKLSEVLRCHLHVDGSLWSKSASKAAYAAGYSRDCNWTNPSGKNKDSASRLVARAAELGRLLASLECLPQDLAPFVFDLDKNEALEKLKTHNMIERYKAVVEGLLNVKTLTAAQTDTIQQLTGRVKRKLKEVNQQHKSHLPEGLPACEFAELADSNPIQFDDPKEQTMLGVSPTEAVTVGGSGSENVLSHAGQNGESEKSSVQSSQLEDIESVKMTIEGVTFELPRQDLESIDVSKVLICLDGTDNQLQKLLGDDITTKPSVPISQVPTNSTATHVASVAQKGDHDGVEKEFLQGNKNHHHYHHNNENNSAQTEYILAYATDGPSLLDNWINHGKPGSSESIRGKGIDTTDLASHGELHASQRIRGIGINTVNSLTHTVTDASEGIRDTENDTINSAPHTVTDAFERIRGTEINTVNLPTHTVTDASERIRGTGIDTINSATHTVTADASERIRGTQINTSAMPTVIEALERIGGTEINTSAMPIVTEVSERIRGTEIKTSNTAKFTVTDALDRISRTGINTINSAMHTVTDVSERIRKTEINTSNSATLTVTDARDRISGTGIDTINSATHTITGASEGISQPGIDTIKLMMPTVTDASGSVRGTVIDATKLAKNPAADASGGIRGPGIDTTNLAAHTVTDASERISGTWINTLISDTHTVRDASEKIKGHVIDKIYSPTQTVIDAQEKIRGPGIDTINSATQAVTDASGEIIATGIDVINSVTHVNTLTDASQEIRGTGMDTVNPATQAVTDASGEITAIGIDVMNSVTHVNTLTDASQEIRGTGMDTVNSATQAVTDEDSYDYPSHDTPEFHTQTFSAGGCYHEQFLKELKSSILEVGQVIDRHSKLVHSETQIYSSVKPKRGHSSQRKEDANEDTRQRRITDFFTSREPSVGMTYFGKRKLRHSYHQAKKRKDI